MLTIHLLAPMMATLTSDAVSTSTQLPLGDGQTSWNFCCLYLLSATTSTLADRWSFV